MPIKKRSKGRPVENEMPEPIPDTPENVARAAMQGPPKKLTMLHRFQRLADFYRFASTSLISVGCIAVHFNLFQGVQMTAGAKAPTLALCAALIFLTELLPKKTMYSALTARIAGTFTTFLAAWNWLLDEGNGDVASVIPPQFVFILITLGVLAFSTLMLTIISGDSNQRKTEDEEPQEGV